MCGKKDFMCKNKWIIRWTKTGTSIIFAENEARIQIKASYQDKKKNFGQDNPSHPLCLSAVCLCHSCDSVVGTICPPFHLGRSCGLLWALECGGSMVPDLGLRRPCSILLSPSWKSAAM